MSMSMSERISAALDASDRCQIAASKARELLRDCRTPDLEVLRRRLTTTMTNLENAKQAASRANRDIAAMLEET